MQAGRCPKNFWTERNLEISNGRSRLLFKGVTLIKPVSISFGSIEIQVDKAKEWMK
jgi:hypothetical protein